MIRPDDFLTNVTSTDAEVCVSVTHLPTGHKRTQTVAAGNRVRGIRDSLIGELRRMLFGDADIRCDTGRAEGGDFIRVVHLPSGIEHWAMRSESTHEELLDAVLEELYAGRHSHTL